MQLKFKSENRPIATKEDMFDFEATKKRVMERVLGNFDPSSIESHKRSWVFENENPHFIDGAKNARDKTKKLIMGMVEDSLIGDNLELLSWLKGEKIEKLTEFKLSKLKKEIVESIGNVFDQTSKKFDLYFENVFASEELTDREKVLIIFFKILEQADNKGYHEVKSLIDGVDFMKGVLHSGFVEQNIREHDGVTNEIQAARDSVIELLVKYLEGEIVDGGLMSTTPKVIFNTHGWKTFSGGQGSDSVNTYEVYGETAQKIIADFLKDDFYVEKNKIHLRRGNSPIGRIFRTHDLKTEIGRQEIAKAIIQEFKKKWVLVDLRNFVEILK